MKRSIAASTATWPTPTRRSASSWNAYTTSNDCTRLWAMSRPPSLSKTAGVSNDVASRRTFQLGTLPPNPRDLSHSRRNDGARRQITLPPLIPAVESALELRPRRALSSAQVFPEWITATSPCNDLSANGDYPLDLLYHPKGSVQIALHRNSPHSSNLGVEVSLGPPKSVLVRMGLPFTQPEARFIFLVRIRPR